MFVNLVLLLSCLSGVATPSTIDATVVNKAICEVIPNETQNEFDGTEWSLASDYETIEDENPNFAREQIIAELYSKKKGSISNDYEINDEEFWAIVLNLWPSQYGTAKSLTQRASTQAQVYYPDLDCYQDDGDAFRHTYWSALLSYEFGSNFALKITTAHESETEEGIDKQMDLHNNMNGTIFFNEWQSKFSSTSIDSKTDIGDFIYHCIANGEIYDCVKIDMTTQKLVYTSLGGSNEAKYNLRSNVNSVLIPDYGYEEQYFFYTKSKVINSTGGEAINTRRKRTGYIEEEYIVLSPRRSNAGLAYLEFIFNHPVDAICVDLTMWSNSELLDTSNSSAYIASSTDGNRYPIQLDFLRDVTLSKDRTKFLLFIKL